MSTPLFDVEEYWKDRGRHYIHEGRLQEEFSLKQIEYVCQVVAELKPVSIFELGCGYGRITRELARRLPDTLIVGMDWSEDQIREARSYCRERNTAFHQGNIVTQRIDITVELVLAIEVFLHIPPESISAVLKNVFTMTDTLLHDFDREHPRLPLSPHVWAHDYTAIYDSMELTHTILESGPYSLIKVINC